MGRLDIKFLRHDATEPLLKEPTVIAHVVNDVGAWGAGFVVPLGQKYPKAKEMFLTLSSKIERKLLIGNIQLCPITEQLYVCNMFAMNGIRSSSNKKPINLEKLQTCLFNLRTWSEKNGTAVIQMPKIGSGLAGGNWSEEIMPLIWRVFATSTLKLRICHT